MGTFRYWATATVKGQWRVFAVYEGDGLCSPLPSEWAATFETFDEAIDDCGKRNRSL